MENCDYYYNCCSCSSADCGCRYCYNCNACDHCKETDKNQNATDKDYLECDHIKHADIW